MRSILAGYDKWSPESIENLTPRQALGYSIRIPKVIQLLAGEAEDGEDKDVDIDDIKEEAEKLHLKPPKGMSNGV